LYVAAQRNERRRITAMGPWQKASIQRGAEGILAKEGNRGGEENRGRESPCILAPAERITITGAQREAEREKERREGDFLLWRGRQAGESGLTE
jgi:hypothetical protein